MRLLNFSINSQGESLTISLEEHTETELPPYAILSHRWGLAGEEVTFDDFVNGTAKLKPSFRKVEGCCRQALDDGLAHVWIDTCCIDKRSSAELSEAIDSMYRYYKKAEVCYAYLQDVTDSKENPEAHGSAFRHSEWFQRGWTLQELIAPGTVIFFSENWTQLGSKKGLAKTLQQITGIRFKCLTSPAKTKNCNISTRMSWASARKTSRIEDRAYSLMGIFDVHMPILYGEGEKAFMKLQMEIVKISVDHSIFAWELPAYTRWRTLCGVFATGPEQFSRGSQIRLDIDRYSKDIPTSYEFTNMGLHIWLPVITVGRTVFARLNCSYLDSPHPGRPGELAEPEVFEEPEEPSWKPFCFHLLPDLGISMEYLRLNPNTANILLDNPPDWESQESSARELFIRTCSHFRMSGDRLDQEFWPNPVVEIDPRGLEEITLVDGNPAWLSSESTNDLSFLGRTSFYHLSRFGAQFHTRVDGKKFALSIQSDLKAISCSMFVSWLPDDGSLPYYSENPSTKMDTD